MSHITRLERVYLAAVGILALWVGIWCYLNPDLSANGIPWGLPPLCASFLGAFYFSGVAAMTASILSQRWFEIRTVMPMIAIWTGGLTIVSVFYLHTFDFTRTQTQVWFIAYISYPLIALALSWWHRSEVRVHPSDEPLLPKWVKLYLRIQGSIMIVLALALLFAPTAMQKLWAWGTGEMMLQLYSMPLLSYGVGSWLAARQRAWSEIRVLLIAVAVFTALELVACIRFQSLLNGATLSVAVWLGWLALTTGVVAILIAKAVRITSALNLRATRLRWHYPTVRSIK